MKSSTDRETWQQMLSHKGSTFWLHKQLWPFLAILCLTSLALGNLALAIEFPREIHLGELHQAENKPFLLKISNPSHNAVIIHNVETSCACTLFDFRAGTELASEESLTISGNVNYGDILGPHYTLVTVHWGYRNSRDVYEAKIRIQGRVVSAAVLSLARIDFGNIPYTTSSLTKSFELKRGNSSEHWSHVIATSSNPAISTEIVPNGQDGFRVEVTARLDGHHLGPVNDSIQLQFRSGDITVPGSLMVPIVMRIVGPLRASPNTVYFGAIRPGTSASRELTINAEDIDLRQAAILSKDPALRCKILSESEGSIRIRLSYLSSRDSAALKPLPIASKLVIKCASDGEELNLEIPVIGAIARLNQQRVAAETHE